MRAVVVMMVLMVSVNHLRHFCPSVLSLYRSFFFTLENNKDCSTGYVKNQLPTPTIDGLVCN